MTRPSHTPRILELLRAGRSPAVIAAELGVTPGRVRQVAQAHAVPRTTLYVSLDDSAQTAWHHHRSMALGAGLEPAPGPSPGERLRLVIAA